MSDTYKAISGDGTAIAYERTGRGAPVVLVGGALCDRRAHTDLARFLGAHFTVLNYDRRGRGDSGETAPYAVEREIEDLAALIADVGGRAAVYGISSGGALALRAAAAGLPITKVIAYEAPYMPSAEQRAERAQDSRVLALVGEGRAEAALEAFLGDTGMPPEAVAAMRDTPEWPGLVAIAPTLVQDYAVMGDSTVPDTFADIRVPTLIADGALTAPFLRDAARVLATTIPGARHVTLPGQTHAVAVEAIAPVLIEFVAEP